MPISILLYPTTSPHWPGRNNAVMVLDVSGRHTDDERDRAPVLAVAPTIAAARSIAAALAPHASVEE